MRSPFHLASVLLLVATLYGGEPFVGTWMLNSSKSGGNIPKDETIVVRKRGDTLIVQVAITTITEPTNQVFTIKFSVPKSGGSGHIEEGPYNGVFMKRPSSREIEITYLVDGKAARSTRATVARDRHTLTSTGGVAGTNKTSEWNLVFDRR